MNEVADLSELCRLCLDSATTLVSFDAAIHFSTKSIPELIKYCVDVDSNVNDGGISPKNICQTCLDKLQVINEFKWKCHESDKYIRQIIRHSGELVTDEADITPYNPPALDESYGYDDEDELLQPMEPMGMDTYNYHDPGVSAITSPTKSKTYKSYPRNNRLQLDGMELKKGQRHGAFFCELCNRTFKYVKPFKNHLKTHKGNAKPLSYYKRRKQFLTQAIGAPVRASQVTAPLAASLTKKKFKPEPQAQYDSISPYNSPAPYERESVALHSNTRDSSPDFGDFMLKTSRQILNGANAADDDDDDEDDLLVEKATPTVGKPARNARKTADSVDMDYNPNGRPKMKPRKPAAATTAAAPEKRRTKSTIEESEPTPKRPGPLSKTRGRPRKHIEDDGDEGGLQIEGFSEVDITKMLKAKRDNDHDFGDDSESQPSHSNRSRSRSSSVELVHEVDIFGRS